MVKPETVQSPGVSGGFDGAFQLRCSQGIDIGQSIDCGADVRTILCFNRDIAFEVVRVVCCTIVHIVEFECFHQDVTRLIFRQKPLCFIQAFQQVRIGFLDDQA